MSEPSHGQPFLSTPRALGACAREFSRLSDHIADLVVGSLGTDRDKIDVRRSPERCIIQVGGSALTVAWIRNSRDSIAEGELLIILWRGTVAPSHRHRPERASEPAQLSATPVDEWVFFAEASCETDWVWRSRDDAAGRYSSSYLAGLVVEHLRTDYDALGAASA